MVEVDDSPWGLHPAGYGQTEVTGMLTYNALGIGTAGTSGRPSPWVQVRIVDPDGTEVPTGETGEIVARGPIITNGYHDRPELNAERFRGGWWHTGDLGRRHDDAIPEVVVAERCQRTYLGIPVDAVMQANFLEG